MLLWHKQHTYSTHTTSGTMITGTVLTGTVITGTVITGNGRQNGGIRLWYIMDRSGIALVIVLTIEEM